MTRLTRWLLDHERAEAPAPEELRVAGLGAYAYTVLPDSHPYRPAFWRDYATSLCRHLRLNSEFLPLCAAWRQAGIDVMLFEGFQLSETVYPATGARPHGDVDVLLRRDQVARAERVAVACGWLAFTEKLSQLVPGNEAFRLARRRTYVAAHREIIHVRLPWAPTQRRITDAVWACSTTRSWQDVDVREPCPADMVVVGLALRRCWGEDWHIKPFDVLDFRYVMSQHALTRAEVFRRARELHCEQTFDAFLERCDPDCMRLDLDRPSDAERGMLEWRALGERGITGPPERKLARLIRTPIDAIVGSRFAPAALRRRVAARVEAPAPDQGSQSSPSRRPIPNERLIS